MLKEMFKLQKEVDNKCLENMLLRGEMVDKKHILVDTIAALFVELGEFANEDRSFKHWSTKKGSSKETQLEEFADCWAFMISIAVQKGWTVEEVKEAFESKHKINLKRQQEGY